MSRERIRVGVGREEAGAVLERLDDRVENTDRLIDEVVSDLYDLTDEEIEIVESTVRDD